LLKCFTSGRIGRDIDLIRLVHKSSRTGGGGGLSHSATSRSITDSPLSLNLSPFLRGEMNRFPPNGVKQTKHTSSHSLHFFIFSRNFSLISSVNRLICAPHRVQISCLWSQRMATLRRLEPAEISENWHCCTGNEIPRGARGKSR
jgi:hypothetical protein